MINHVTYHLSQEAIGYSCLEEIMVDLLGFEEVKPDDPFEHGYNVRWFRVPPPPVDPFVPVDQRKPFVPSPVIHFVADDTPESSLNVYNDIGLGHFCVVVAPDRYEACRKSDYCSRDSGSGRIWLEYDSCRLRIEVRSR